MALATEPPNVVKPLLIGRLAVVALLVGVGVKCHLVFNPLTAFRRSRRALTIRSQLASNALAFVPSPTPGGVAINLALQSSSRTTRIAADMMPSTFGCVGVKSTLSGPYLRIINLKKELATVA